ncbi:MAG: hypothetical protein KC776_19220, partial [Myxococcales bacterium]|nr:hypothetical protein [Myxococcales bacterium]
MQLERITSDPPISRHTGPRAELAHLRARVESCARAGDAEGERDAAAALSRALAARGAELDTATKLARRALLLGDDAVLREELAQWFSMLGEPALAARTLRPLLATVQGSTKARMLTRIGVLLGRGGDAAAAADALFEAAREDPSDPVAPELLGGIGAWAPTAVSRERAAEAYLEGARRREGQGDRASAFENLLRSFELAPSEPEPAEKLAKTLSGRGRAGAADEVIREHARASADRGRQIHLQRLAQALENGDVPRALGAALDAKLDADIGVERFTDASGAKDTRFHELLERAGLFELLAAHLELGAESLTGRDRARALVELGRIYEGPLVSPDRASRAWTDALVAAPNEGRALSALMEHAGAARDFGTLADALLEVALAHELAPGLDVVLRELAEIAERRLDAPVLAVWALDRLEALGDAAAAADRQRLEPRAKERRTMVAELRARLDRATGEHRHMLSAELAALIGPWPSAVDEEIATLREVIASASEAAETRLRLERVLERSGRLDELDAEYRAALGSGEPERLRLGLARLRRRRGDLDGALEELVPLLDDPGARPLVWSMAAVIAARIDSPGVRARALLRISAPLGPTLRAVIAAVAAESLLDAGDVDAARSAAEAARHADPSLARPVGVLAAVALRLGPDRAAAEALERAMGVIVPRAALCEALAEAHEALGEPALCLAWTQRWLALRPGDPRAARTLLGRVTETGDATRLADALSWLLSQPQPLRDMASAIGAALLRLAELDAPRAAGIARRALDVLGPRAPEIPDIVLAVADVAEEGGLAIAVLERALAVGGDDDRPARLLELARRRRASGDADGA